MSESSIPLTRRFPGYIGHIIALACLGFLSGLATVASFHFGYGFDEISLKGGLFGTFIALYLCAFRKIPSPWKAALLVATTVVAYNLAVVALGGYFHDFFAGAVGGCLIFAAVLFLATPDLSGLQRYGLVILFSAGAGVLGGLGWSLGPSLGVFVSKWMDQLGVSGRFGFPLSDMRDPVYAVHPVWQSGVGALIGVLLWAVDRRTPLSQTAGKKLGLSVPAKLFFACMLLFASITVFNVLRALPGPWQAHRP